MRVLVTGASGFLGRRLVARLAGEGATVGALAIDQHPLAAGVEWMPLDIRDAAAVDREIVRWRPERVVHLAALSHVGDSWRRPAEHFAVNVLGAENVFAAARRADAATLFVSSAEIYGIVPESEQPIGEDRPPAPRSPYALTKAAAERLALRDGATVVRCFNLVGPGQGPTFALPSFAAQLAALRLAGVADPVLRVGNLSARRDFVHVDDAVDGLAMLTARPRPGAVLNLATGADLSIAEALARLIALAGLEVRQVEDPERLRPVDVPRLCGNAARLRALGWRPTRSVDEALAELWREALAEVERGGR